MDKGVCPTAEMLHNQSGMWCSRHLPDIMHDFMFEISGNDDVQTVMTQHGHRERETITIITLYS